MAAATPDALADFLAKARGSLDRRAAANEAVDVATLWSLASLRGRLVELSARGASATLTTSIELVLEAQLAGEPVAWIMLDAGSFYPPDVADAGVDLAALVVIRVHDATGAARAAERTLRSGAFGLVVLDLSVGAESSQRLDISMAHQGRLVSLAQAHDAAVVVLTEKSADAASLGSLVSLHAEALRARASSPSAGFELTIRALKDKRRGPGWTKKSKARGPAGF
jgi:recombination protein RecA